MLTGSLWCCGNGGDDDDVDNGDLLNVISMNTETIAQKIRITITENDTVVGLTTGATNSATIDTPLHTLAMIPVLIPWFTGNVISARIS